MSLKPLKFDHKFRRLGNLPIDTAIEGFPYRIYAIVGVEDEANSLHQDGQVYSLVDGCLDNPAVDDFFFVHRESKDGYNNWICEARGEIFLAAWIHRSTSYKGTTFVDTGYFYCPYVPLMTTPVVLDQSAFSPHKGIITRYGKKLLEKGSKATVAVGPKEKTQMRPGEKLFIGVAFTLSILATIAYFIK